MLYDRVAELPLEIEAVELSLRERETSSDFTRATTTVALHGAGETGRGEDVTYETDLHHDLADAGLPDLTGSYSLAEFSETIDERALFPTAPEREDFYHYRRWGVESAALDLALRQADTDLASVLDRSYDPVRFVVSTRLGEPPTFDRIEALLAVHGDLEFKLDPTPDWDDDLIATVVDQPADPDLYRRLVDAFPEAVLEDPALTDETEAALAGHEERVSWDLPIRGIDSLDSLPFEPDWLNIKPSRFGSVESLLDTIEYCLERDIDLYGGGQFELGVGRQHIQALASLFYADGPNDVAPAGYNDPDLGDDLPASPLAPPETPAGLRWESPSLPE
jgi:hypothetical protein